MYLKCTFKYIKRNKKRCLFNLIMPFLFDGRSNNMNECPISEELFALFLTKYIKIIQKYLL